MRIEEVVRRTGARDLDSLAANGLCHGISAVCFDRRLTQTN